MPEDAAAAEPPATPSKVLRRRFGVASPAGALVLVGLVLALLAAVWPLSGLARQSVLSGSAELVLCPVFGAVGFVVAWRRPANPLGWLMLGAVGFLLLSDDAGFYAVADYRLRHGDLPLGWLAVLLQPGWAPAIALFGVLVLLFPDGRAPSPRWRPVLWIYLAAAGLWVAGALIISAWAIIEHNVQVDSGGNLLLIDHPVGSLAWWGTAQFIFFLSLAVFWLASVAGQVASYRRSSGERRLQLKWLVSGSAIAAVGGVAGVWLSSSPSESLRVVGGIGVAAVIALPVSIGVAITKYRLYDIDRVISRTLAYAIITGALVGVYAGIVLLATQVVSITTSVAVAAATLAAAALFNPLRQRVQRIVDRRFNRARYDADRTVATFAARLQDAVDLDAVSEDLAQVVDRALQPSHISVWINQGS